MNKYIFKIVIYAVFKKKLLYITLFFLTVACAILETLSVIYVTPLVASISSGLETARALYSFGIVILLTGAFKIALLIFQNKAAFTSGVDLNTEILNSIVSASVPYVENREKSKYVTQIQLKCQNVIYGIFLPFFSICSSLLTILILTGYLFLYNIEATLFLIGIIGSVVTITFNIVKNKLNRLSGIVTQSFDQITNKLLATLSNIREIRVYQKQGYFINQILDIENKLRHSQAMSSIIGNLPRTILETIALLSLLFLAGTDFSSEGSFAAVLALIATLGFSAQKLLPASQQIFNGLATIAANTASAIDILDELQNDVKYYENSSKTMPGGCVLDGIHFNNITCTHGEEPLFNPINVHVPIGSMVTFVGPSGIGKSTLLLTLTGLVNPLRGTIEMMADGDKYLVSPEFTSYASQQTVLENKDVYQNISLDDTLYDEDRINSLLIGLGLYEEICTHKDGIKTKLGESGNLLSGGQKQRLGIARALYFDRPILILDEATSGLNEELELKVLKFIREVSRHKIIVCSAHRTSVMKFSDLVVKLERK